MRILFCTSRLPAALIIRAATWSDWHHVAIIDGDDVIEATWNNGVCVSRLDDVIAKNSRYAIAEISCEDDSSVINAARSQIGKPYDMSAIFGIALRRNWQKSDAWFCSELVAWSFAQAGFPKFRPESLYRITPQHLWMISK